MAEQESAVRFAVELDPTALQKGGQDAENATDSFRQSLERGLEALDRMQKSVGVLRKIGGSKTQIGAVREEMDKLKASMKSGVDQFEKAGGKLDSLARKKTTTAEAAKALSASVSNVGGPLANLVAHGKSVASIFGGAGSAGVLGAMAAVTGVALIVTAAIVGLTAALGHFALGAANAHRSELLMLEGMTKIPNMWGLAAGKATELQAAISSVSANVALGRDRVVGFAQDLYKAGLRGENLRLALEGTSIATSAAGESYGSMVKGWLSGTAMVGGSVKNIVQQIKNRFGGVARAQMLDLNVQFAKMKENLRALFSGLNIEGFLDGLNKILSLFSDTTAVGRALKGTLELILQPLYSGFGRLQPIVKRFFQGATIASLQFQIKVLELRNWILDKLGDRKIFAGIDWLTVALKAGQVAMWGLIAIGGSAIAVLAAVATPFITLGIAITKAGQAISNFWTWLQSQSLQSFGEALGRQFVDGLVFNFVKLPKLAWGAISTAFSAIKDFVLNDSADVGESLISGLIKGITSAAKGLYDVVSGIGKGIKEEFAKVLGIHSPSTVFASFGRFTALGFAQGVDRGAPVAQASVVEMATPPSMMSQPTLPAMTSSSSTVSNTTSGHTLQFGDIHVHGAGGKEQAQDFMSQLAAILEGASFSIGAR